MKQTVKFILNNFGPLIIFYISNRIFGLKIAIGLSVVYTLSDVAYRKIKHEKITAFFIFSAAITIFFGVIDLFLPAAFLFNYEASFTNVATAAFFFLGAFNKKPLIQEFAERKRSFDRPDAPDLVYYFRLLTLVWASYFLMKAGFYTWLAQQPMSDEKKLALRTSIGSTSFYLLLGASIFGSRKLFYGLKKLGWLPKPKT